MITINLNKAKDITKDRLRTERAPLLQQLDVDFMKAVEVQADTSDIVAEKERLRNITAQVDDAKTAEELKLIKVNDNVETLLQS
jgi:hypothetical protein